MEYHARKIQAAQCACLPQQLQRRERGRIRDADERRWDHGRERASFEPPSGARRPLEPTPADARGDNARTCDGRAAHPGDRGDEGAWAGVRGHLPQANRGRERKRGPERRHARHRHVRAGSIRDSSPRHLRGHTQERGREGIVQGRQGGRQGQGGGSGQGGEGRGWRRRRDAAAARAPPASQDGDGATPAHGGAGGPHQGSEGGGQGRRRRPQGHGERGHRHDQRPSQGEPARKGDASVLCAEIPGFPGPRQARRPRRVDVQRGRRRASGDSGHSRRPRAPPGRARAPEKGG
mmetsp:Transcript_8979/g.36711  ORF Transcript_8979/g.36711 Transcript_8979/m.36711 type:complete len:292 (+) Transcript_8979:387-1262(+)